MNILVANLGSTSFKFLCFCLWDATSGHAIGSASPTTGSPVPPTQPTAYNGNTFIFFQSFLSYNGNPGGIANMDAACATDLGSDSPLSVSSPSFPRAPRGATAETGSPRARKSAARLSACLRSMPASLRNSAATSRLL